MNGADRMVDGSFGMVPARKFHADGRTHVTMDRQLEHEVVALARSYHWPWCDVGDALGVSRSAAQRRFAQFEVPFRMRRQQKGPP